MDARLRIWRILWAALLSAIGIYVALTFIVEPPPNATDGSLMLVAFGVTAAGVLAASIVVPNLLRRTIVANLKPEIDEVPDPNGQAMFRDMAPTIKVVTNSEAVVSSYVAGAMTPFILTLALREAIAIFGFTLHMLGSERGLTGPFFVVAFAAIAYEFPLKARLLGQLEKALGAQLQL